MKFNPEYCGRYKPLAMNFNISYDLQAAINAFLNCINNADGSCEDCYRTEIACCLKYDRRKLTDEQYQLLKEYYVHGGIYDAVT